MRLLILAAAAAFALPAAAQTPAPAPSPATRAMAAGYKALTVCSAVMETGRTVESVEANELVGVYPELDGLVREMPAVVDDSRGAVSVAWNDEMPPRIAVWQPQTGCSIMPVGWNGRLEEWLLTPGHRIAPPLPTAVPSDPEAVDAILGRTMGGAYGEGSRTTAVVIVQNDAVVGERYAEGFGRDTRQRTWSVAKSIAGTLIGAAVQRGEVDVHAPAAISGWQRPGDPRAAITLDQLLRMSSGLTSDTAGNRTDAIYFGGVGVDEQVTTWPLVAQPGTRFRYANNDILLATQAVPSLEPEAFFSTLKMRRTIAERDWRGNLVLSSQVWASAQDLARRGHRRRAHPAGELAGVCLHAVRTPAGGAAGLWRDLLADEPVRGNSN